MANLSLNSKQQRQIETLICVWSTKLTWNLLTKAIETDLGIKISRQSLHTYTGIKNEFDKKKAELRGASPDILMRITQSDIQLVDRVNRLEKENGLLKEVVDRQLAMIKRILANANEIPNLDINVLVQPRSNESE